MNQHPASWAWEQNVKGLSKLVLLGLADYSGTKNKAAWPSFETLAKKCGISRSTIVRAIKDLVKAGLVTKENRPNSSNLYHLNLKYLSDTEEAHSDTSTVSEEHHGGITETPKPIKNQSVTNQLTKEGEWGVEETKAKKVELPKALNTSAFKAAWSSYLQYLREIKKPPPTPSSVKQKWAEMAKWGHDQAINAIEQTIGNGWKGIFEPNASSSKPRAEGAPRPEKSSAKKSAWELKQQIDAINVRLDELRLHRAEVAGGNYVWDNPTLQSEFRLLCMKRKGLNTQLIEQ